MTDEGTRAAIGPGASRPPWRLVATLAAVNAALWVVPRLRGRGPLGEGAFRVALVYLGLVAAVGLLASLVVALAPAARRRAVALRGLAVVAAAALALPAGDLAYAYAAGRLGQIPFYSLSYPRSQNDPDPDLIWKRKPGLSWRGRKTPDCEAVEYRTDERGFRNPPGLERADIVFLGDSVTEAGEVAEAETFVRRVGESLGLATANLGTSGYGPQQELAVLRRYGLGLRPRLVVWQVTEWNDLQDARMYLGRDDPAASAGPPWEVVMARHSPALRLASALLPGRPPSTIAVRLTDGRTVRQGFWPHDPYRHRQLPDAFAATVGAIAEARDLCRERGIDFVVVYVPSHVRVLAPDLIFRDERERDRFLPGGLSDRDDDLSRALAAACREADIPLIDLAGPLRRRAARDNRRVYVPNDPHLGPDGHDEMARAVVDFVRERPGRLGAGAAAALSSTREAGLR